MRSKRRRNCGGYRGHTAADGVRRSDALGGGLARPRARIVYYYHNIRGACVRHRVVSTRRAGVYGRIITLFRSGLDICAMAVWMSSSANRWLMVCDGSIRPRGCSRIASVPLRFAGIGGVQAVVRAAERAGPLDVSHESAVG